MSSAGATRVIGGRYVVLAELGRGAMGVVWRAEDRVLDRQVAVKELQLPWRLGAEERRLFGDLLLREVRSAGRLHDPGVVAVHDVVSDDGTDHVVMELVEGRTLAEAVSADGPLDGPTATDVARKLLSALRAAHRAGLLHGDVKPGNVMLGPGTQVRLTDFGIAAAAADPRISAAGLHVGSPGYLAPERLEGSPAEPPSDLWALGATLYFAVHGSGPFERATGAETLAAVRQGELPPVAVPAPLGTVINGLLCRTPDDRLTGPRAAALLPVPDASPATGSGGSRSRSGSLWPAMALAVGLGAGLAGGVLLERAAGPQVPTVSYGAGGDVPVFAVDPPACLAGPLTVGMQVPAGSAVPCDAPHDLEVFGRIDPFPAVRSPAYPGRERLDELAAACGVGAGEGSDALALVPSQPAFESGPDRGVYCLLRTAGR